MSSPSGTMSTPTSDSNFDSQSQPARAASRVFAIVELAEAILNELPPCDLLLSQRVCKSFRDTFQGSIEIKKRLHLLPSTSKIMSLPPLWPDPHIHMWKGYSVKAIGAGEVDPDVIVLEFPCEGKAFPEWLTRDLSWRKMQAGSPPVCTGRMIGVREWRECDNGEGEVAWITCERGFTLGDLVDLAGRLKKESPDVYSISLSLGPSEVDDGDFHAPKRYFF